jgi:hypothetical protein
MFKHDGIKGKMKNAVWSTHNVKEKLDMWIEGRTGYPFCDSFMREIAKTGYAVHCGRECVAWFLVRDLKLDWRLGAEYFEHILIDYEVTANWGNWAYRVVGYHPTEPTLPNEGLKETASGGLQTVEMLHWAHQHDPHAVHVKAWLPELKPLPAKVALEPWRMLMGDLSPVLEIEFECARCTLVNEKHVLHCVACGAQRRLGEYCGFVFGESYPPPFGMSKSYLPPVNTHTDLFTNGPQPRARVTHPDGTQCEGRMPRALKSSKGANGNANGGVGGATAQPSPPSPPSQGQGRGKGAGARIKPRPKDKKKKKNRLQTDIGQAAK